MEPSREDCAFCKIVRGTVSAAMVFRDERCLAFLDHRPLFRGHTLLVPLAHYETLPELPGDLIQPFFANSQLLVQAVQEGLGVDGAFVALNHRVSQSVPHVHLHVIPRRFKDGLKGFFWPREKYGSNAEMEDTARKIGAVLDRLRAGTAP